MDETKRRLDVRVVLGVLAIVLAAATVWAASALAAGPASTNEPAARDGPAVADVQNESEAPDGDCPDRGSDSEPSSDA